MAKKSLPPSKKKPFDDYLKYSGLAFQMIAIIAAGMYGGYRLDNYLLLSKPIFTLMFSLSAVLIAIYFALKDFFIPKK